MSIPVKDAYGDVYPNYIPVNHPDTAVEVVQYVFKDQAPLFLRIMDAETNFDCDSVSYKNPNSTAKGCFQILDGTWRDHKCKGDDHYDFRANILCAYKLYLANGTTDWNASKENWE